MQFKIISLINVVIANQLALKYSILLEEEMQINKQLKNPFSQQNTIGYLVKQQTLRIHTKNQKVQNPFFYKSKKIQYQQSTPYFSNSLQRNYSTNSIRLKATNQYDMTRDQNFKQRTKKNQLKQQRWHKQHYSNASPFLTQRTQIQSSLKSEYHLSSQSNLAPCQMMTNIRQHYSRIGQKILSDRWKRQKLQYESIRLYGPDIGLRHLPRTMNDSEYFPTEIGSNFDTENTDMRQQRSFSSKKTALFGSNQKVGYVQSQSQKQINSNYLFEPLRASGNINKYRIQKNKQDDQDNGYRLISCLKRRSSKQVRRSSSKQVRQLIGINSTNNLNSIQYKSESDIIDTIPQDIQTKIIRKSKIKSKKQKCSMFRRDRLNSDESFEEAEDRIVQSQEYQIFAHRKPKLKKQQSIDSTSINSNSQFSGKIKTAKTCLKNSSNAYSLKGFKQDEGNC